MRPADEQQALRDVTRAARDLAHIHELLLEVFALDDQPLDDNDRRRDGVHETAAAIVKEASRISSMSRALRIDCENLTSRSRRARA